MKHNEATTLSAHNGAPPLLVSRRDARYYLGGICLKTLENLIKAGTLTTVKVRRRTMIPFHALTKLARVGASDRNDATARKPMEEKNEKKYGK